MKSISIPFSFTSDTGAISTTTSLDAIMEQNIIDILTTSPGERVMQPKYGASIRNLLFEEADPLVFAEYRMDAITDLNANLPFGRVTDVQIGIPNETFSGSDYDTTVSISVKYVVPPYNSSVVTFNISNTTTNGGF
jgi:phage baseplate assembly protein W